MEEEEWNLENESLEHLEKFSSLQKSLFFGWNEEEISLFWKGIRRYGKHAIQSIANLIESKNLLQVAHKIDLLNILSEKFPKEVIHEEAEEAPNEERQEKGEAENEKMEEDEKDILSKKESNTSNDSNILKIEETLKFLHKLNPNLKMTKEHLSFELNQEVIKGLTEDFLGILIQYTLYFAEKRSQHDKRLKCLNIHHSDVEAALSYLSDKTSKTEKTEKEMRQTTENVSILKENENIGEKETIMQVEETTNIEQEEMEKISDDVGRKNLKKVSFSMDSKHVEWLSLMNPEQVTKEILEKKKKKL